MRENNKFHYLISFSSSPSSSLLYPFMSLPSSVSAVISSPSFPLQISIFHNGLNMSFSYTSMQFSPLLPSGDQRNTFPFILPPSFLQHNHAILNLCFLGLFTTKHKYLSTVFHFSLDLLFPHDKRSSRNGAHSFRYVIGRKFPEFTLPHSKY